MKSTAQHLVLAGGGLANCLIALRMAQRHPETQISIVEAGPAVGGNHTWSFHMHDLNAEQRDFLSPLVQYHWPAQQVRFPRYRRNINAGYRSITSSALQRHMDQQTGIKIHTGESVTDLAPDHVQISGGKTRHGTAVIDARGPKSAEGLVLGFQKFVGHEVRTQQPHGVECPVIMDATVSQADGYRFMYLLPFDETTLLIEDTRYSDGAELTDETLASEIEEYAGTKGWKIVETLRTERGVLPILMAADFDRFWPAGDPIARAGLRAGLFHPTTGYSLPQAMALADAISAHWPMDGRSLAAFTRNFSQRFWANTGFFRLLNRMLFRAGRPEERYRVMQRFYTLSEPLITNFYAIKLKLHQKSRILVGKPPVPFFVALSLVRERPFMRREQ